MTNPDKVLELATLAGRCLLESGAETYRVEDTICRICKSLHADQAESFCLPTGIFVSAVFDKRTCTKVVRIQNRSTNLDRIDRINQLSRDASQLDETQFEQRLNAILTQPTYNKKIDVLFAAFGAFGFTFVFFGTLRDALASLFIGALLRCLMIFFDRKQIDRFFSSCIESAFLTFCALGLNELGLILGYEKTIIGTIMLLVPGLAITNAVRDSLAGDLVSGMARGAEAILVAISVAIGSGLVMTFWMMMGGQLL